MSNITWRQYRKLDKRLTKAEARAIVIRKTVDALVAEFEGVDRCSNLSAPSPSSSAR